MRLRAGLVAGALAIVVVADVAAVALHDEATPYTTEQALQEFRAEAAPSPGPPSTASLTPGPSTSATPSSRPPASAVPTAGTTGAASPAPARSAAAAERLQPGVYTYATSGHEEVDILGGSRHDYPAETTVTYRRLPCGVQTRWQPLQERFSTDDVCQTSAGGELRRAAQRHTFFGQSDDEDLVCALVLLPAQPRKGQVSTGSCRSKDTTVALRREVLGLTRMDVGGRSTEVVHLMVTGRLTGTARGVTKRESWLTRGGLLVRTVSVVDSDRKTEVGTAHYIEQYELNLKSLDPQS